jgi:hypothetical protein
MRASEFVVEKKKRKRRPRWAAYGPGPYGGYGYAVGYSGDSGGSEGGGGERSGQVIIDGSDIRTYASRTIHNYAETGWYAVKAGASIYSQAGGQQIHQANGRVDLVGSQVHFNSIGADPSLVQPLKRSDMGTAETDVTDVTGNLVTDSNGNIVVQNGKLYETKIITGMTGMIVPTHEPYDKHRDKKK